MKYDTPDGDRCFACAAKLGKAKRVDTRDGQTVFVGPDCYRNIVAAGEQGWQPRRGGPRLYVLDGDTDAAYVRDHVLSVTRSTSLSGSLTKVAAGEQGASRVSTAIPHPQIQLATYVNRPGTPDHTRLVRTWLTVAEAKRVRDELTHHIQMMERREAGIVEQMTNSGEIGTGPYHKEAEGAR